MIDLIEKYKKLTSRRDWWKKWPRKPESFLSRHKPRTDHLPIWQKRPDGSGDIFCCMGSGINIEVTSYGVIIGMMMLHGRAEADLNGAYLYSEIIKDRYPEFAAKLAGICCIGQDMQSNGCVQTVTIDNQGIDHIFEPAGNGQEIWKAYIDKHNVFTFRVDADSMEMMRHIAGLIAAKNPDSSQRMIDILNEIDGKQLPLGETIRQEKIAGMRNGRQYYQDYFLWRLRKKISLNVSFPRADRPQTFFMHYMGSDPHAKSALRQVAIFLESRDPAAARTLQDLLQNPAPRQDKPWNQADSHLYKPNPDNDTDSICYAGLNGLRFEGDISNPKTVAGFVWNAYMKNLRAHNPRIAHIFDMAAIHGPKHPDVSINPSYTDQLFYKSIGFGELFDYSAAVKSKTRPKKNKTGYSKSAKLPHGERVHIRRMKQLAKSK